MTAAAHAPSPGDRLDFAPPRPRGDRSGFALALLAHLLLMLALAWGVNWTRQDDSASVQAELWAALPPEPQPEVAPPAPQEVKPPEPTPNEAEIALEKAKLEREREQREEQDRLAREKKKRELEAREKQEQAQRAADKKKQEVAAARKAKEEAEREKRRKETLAAAQAAAAAAAAGDVAATGSGRGGPSDSYAGRIRARIKPNIVFTDNIAGNPLASVEVRLAPDGRITSRRMLQSSGVASWDEAVLRALDRTEVLPRDLDGRVHSPLTIEFRPKDF